MDEVKLKLSARDVEPDFRLIIALDAEWVEEPDPPEIDGEEPDEDPGPDPTPPRNIILSYQYACRFVLRPGEEPAAECDWSGIIYTRHARRLLSPHLSEEELAKIPERLEFNELLGIAIQDGIKQGKLREWPKAIIATAHWTRADLASMADYAVIKNQFNAVNKTYVSFSSDPYKASFTQKDRHLRKFNVRLMDTMLLSPGQNKTLDALGERYGLKKFDTGYTAIDGAQVPYKEHMDLYLRDRADDYEQYAIRDAEISALHIQKMAKFVRDDLGLRQLPLTLGSIAVKFALERWEELGIKRGEVNGFVVKKEKRFNNKTGKYVTVKWEEPNKTVKIHREMVELAFYGGRNETFWFGATPVGEFREFDIAGTYTTALSSLKILDYSAAYVTTDPYEFSPDEVGFARLRFRFPDDCRYPCLPVMADDQRGLVYPMRGETCATSPEIALALHLGAEIEILHGVVIPWVLQGLNRPKPFEGVISELTNRRRQHPDGSFENAMYKDLGNTLYGKTVQGVRGKKAYNTKTDAHEPIGKSKITNIFIGAYVTGLVRALLSELIAGVPRHYIIVSATTDSIITNCPQDEIPMNGPVARFMGRVRQRLAELDTSGRTKPDLLDVKSHTARLLSWRTRGIATLEPVPGGKIKLAKGGVKAPVSGYVAQNDWFVTEVLTSAPGGKVKSRDPMPFTTAHRLAADHRFVQVEKAANFEYDHKRKIVSPTAMQIPVPGEPDRTVEHLAAATVPWRTVAEFNENRELFEQWRFAGEGRRLKIVADWEDWQQFLAGTAASRAGVRRSKHGIVQQALRVFFKAFFWQKWGLIRGKGRDFRWAAEQLTAAGHKVKEQDIKNAGRSDDLHVPENVIPAGASGIRELVLTLRSI
jgi:hypothetical protein